MAEEENIDVTTPEQAPPVQAESDPSPGVTAESPAAPTDVNAADSSPAEGVEDKKSLLDVAREVLAKNRTETVESQAPPAEESPPSVQEAETTVTTTTAESDDTAPDDFRDSEELPFGKHPRFKKLLTQWRDDREPARQYRQVQAFLDQNGVPPESAAEFLKQSALLQHARKGSAEHAKLLLKDLDTVRSELRQMLGEEIPEDLRERVELGQTDEQTAKELAQARTRLSLTERQREEDREKSEAQARQSAAQSAKAALVDWESQIRTRDADYEKKAPLVLRTAKALAAERGAPRTAEEAVQLAVDAYKEVNDHLKRVVPPPQAKRPAAPPQPGSASLARPQPKTLLDVVRLAASRGASA